MPVKRGMIQPQQILNTCASCCSKYSCWLYGQIASNSSAGPASAQIVLSVAVRPSSLCHCTWTASPLAPACQHPVTGYRPMWTAKHSAPEGKGLGMGCRDRKSCWHRNMCQKLRSRLHILFPEGATVLAGLTTHGTGSFLDLMG